MLPVWKAPALKPIVTASLGAIVLAVLALGGPSTASAEESAAPAPGALAGLQAELQALVDGYAHGGEYAVAVTDLQTGETIAVNGDRWHLSACSINLLLLLQTTIDLQSGRLKQEQVDALMQSTIYSSNAVTARDLYGVIGSGSIVGGVYRVDHLIESIGLPQTILDHPPAFPAWSIGKHPGNWLTALDANRILSEIWSGSLLRDDWRAWLLDRLTVVKPGLNYLTAITPDSRVSHKNGFFPATNGTYVDNDVAIVRFTAGGQEYAYALSFFSQSVPVEYGDVALGQAITMRTYEAFRAQYGY